MFLSRIADWLTSRSGNISSRHRRPGRHHRPAYRPRLEPLENRIVPSTIDHFAILAPPQFTAGNAADVTVIAEDATNAPVTDFTDTVTFTSSDGQANLPNDYTFTDADHGSHTFQVTLFTAGDQEIDVSDVDQPYATGSAIVSVSPAAVDHLAVDAPSSSTTGDNFDMTVTAQDVYGNTVTDYAGTVAFTSSDAQASLPGNYTFTTDDQGSQTFPASLVTVGQQSITLTDVNQSNLTATANIDVIPGALDHFAVDVAPSTVAGASLDVTVSAEDANGNVISDYAGTVTFISSDPQANLPDDYAFTTDDQGSHTFHMTLFTAGDQEIDVSDVDQPYVTSSAIVSVSPAAVDQFTIDAPSSSTSFDSFDLTVTAQDVYGNTVTDYAGTVAFTSSDAQASLPGNYTFTTDDQGSQTFPASLVTVGQQSITITDVHQSKLTATANVDVIPVALDHFAVDVAPSTVAGASLDVTVSAEDANGNVIGDYTGTVTFVGSDPQANLPDDYAFTTGDHGSHTFQVTLFTAGDQEIDVSDVDQPYATGSAIVSVSPAAVDYLAFDAPSSSMAGDSFDLTVTAQDAYGNTVTDYAGTVAFTSSDAQASLPGNYTFTTDDQGSQTFPASLVTVGQQSITLTDVNQSNLTATANIDVIPGALDHFAVDVAPSTVAGASLDVTVSAEDANGNVISDYTGTVTFVSSDPQANLPDDYAFTTGDHGSHTFQVTLFTAGDQEIDVIDVDQSYVTGSPSVMVSPGPMDHVTFEFPDQVTADTPFTAVAVAQDAFGNTVSDDISEVTIAAQGPGPFAAGSTTSEPASGGVATFSNLTLDTAGTYTFSVTGGAWNGAVSAPVAVLPGQATQLEITAQPPTAVTAGSSFGIVVEATDPSGNIDTSFNGSITLDTTNDTGGSTLGGDLTLDAVDGVATFSGLTLDQAGYGYTLEATADGLETATTNDINVTAGTATQLVLVSPPPSTVAAGAGIRFAVAAEDSFGNVSNSFNGKMSVSLASNPNGAQLTGTLTATAVSGVALFTQLSVQQAESDFTLEVNSGALQPVTTDDIDVTASDYSARVIKGSGQSATVGTAFASALQVVVTDAQGKPAANVAVTFAFFSGNGAGGTLSDVTVNTNAAGMAAPTLTANTIAGRFTVTVAVEDVVLPAVFTETNKAGVPASVVVVGGAGQTATVGTAVAHRLQVVVQDQYGNVVPNAVVTFAAPASGASGTLGGTTRVHVTTNAAGVGSAPNFVAGKLPGTYAITASVKSSAGTFTTSLSETNAAGPPTRITIRGGASQHAKVGGVYSVPLQVVVTDRFGNHLSGVGVTFQLPSVGAGGTFADGNATQVVVNTDSSGVATAPPLTANAIAGAFSVTVSVVGIKSPLTLKETNTTS